MTENIVMTVDRVAAVTGLTRAAIYQAGAVAGLGAPGHFVYAGGIVVYTFAGLCALVDVLQLDHAAAAKSLAFSLKQQRERVATSPDAEVARRIAQRWDVKFEMSVEVAA
jgi:hypothetical protein